MAEGLSLMGLINLQLPSCFIRILMEREDYEGNARAKSVEYFVVVE